MHLQDDYFSFAIDVTDYSKMIPWERTVANPVMDLSIGFNELFVVTKETIRCSFFFQLFMKYDQHMLVSGKTGTGKTRIISNEINSICSNPENNKTLIPITFTCQTSVTDLQNQMEG